MNLQGIWKFSLEKEKSKLTKVLKRSKTSNSQDVEESTESYDTIGWTITVKMSKKVQKVMVQPIVSFQFIIIFVGFL